MGKKNGWFWRWDWDQQKGCDGMPVICHPELAIRHRQSVRCEMNKFDDMMLLGMKGAVFGNRVAGIVAMNFVTFDSCGNRMWNFGTDQYDSSVLCILFWTFLDPMPDWQDPKQPWTLLHQFWRGFKLFNIQKTTWVSYVCNPWSFGTREPCATEKSPPLVGNMMIWATRRSKEASVESAESVWPMWSHEFTKISRYPLVQGFSD